MVGSSGMGHWVHSEWFHFPLPTVGMETVGRPMLGVLRRPCLFVGLFVPRCCGVCVLVLFGVEDALVCGWISITNSPRLQLASDLGDSFGYPRFWGFVTGVLILSLVCCNVVCLEGLLLVAIFASFSFVCQFLFYGYWRFFCIGLVDTIWDCLPCCILYCFGYVFDCLMAHIGESFFCFLTKEQFGGST